jgi:hypothetical protein
MTQRILAPLLPFDNAQQANAGIVPARVLADDVGQQQHQVGIGTPAAPPDVDDLVTAELPEGGMFQQQDRLLETVQRTHNLKLCLATFGRAAPAHQNGV